MATNDQDAPRAVIHRRILDAAASEPAASMEELAEEVVGASTDLVERVLDEYGDPAQAAAHEETITEGESMSEHATVPTQADLTDKERETLRAIADHPAATQAGLAEHLGVSRATVNKRLNDIEGFEWQDRHRFVDAVLGEERQESPADPDGSERDAASAGAASDGGHLSSTDVEATLEELQARVARLEEAADERDVRAGPALDDPALVAKLVRAVMADETISEAEELRILEAIL